MRTGKYLLMVKFMTADIIYLYVISLYHPRHIITHLYASELNAKKTKKDLQIKEIKFEKAYLLSVDKSKAL